MKRAAALFLVFLILAAATAGLGYFQFVFKPAMIKGFITGMPQPLQAVAAAEVTSENWAPQLRSIGTFRAVQGVEVAGQVGGVIRAIRFESAQDVKKGDVLVELDDSTEQADLKAGLAALANANATFERQSELAVGGSTSRANLDQARAARDQAAAQVERVRAVIAQKMITAPFAGRLGIRRIDVGQYASPGAALITLQQLDPIFADFPMPEQTLAVMAVGQPVEIAVDAFPGRTFTGQVKFIDARVAPDTRSFLVRAQMPNPEKKLLPGMFANVTVRAGQPAAVLTTPRTAITYSLYGDSVMVLKPAPPPPGSAQAATPAQSDQVFTVERRPVKVGDVRGDKVSVLDGLAKGERVVVEGQLKLQPNARVKIDPAAGLPPMSPMPRE